MIRKIRSILVRIRNLIAVFISDSRPWIAVAIYGCDESIYTQLQKIMLLALIPEADITPIFETSRREALTVPLQRFFEYVAYTCIFGSTWPPDKHWYWRLTSCIKSSNSKKVKDPVLCTLLNSCTERPVSLLFTSGWYLSIKKLKIIHRKTTNPYSAKSFTNFFCFLFFF